MQIMKAEKRASLTGNIGSIMGAANRARARRLLALAAAAGVYGTLAAQGARAATDTWTGSVSQNWGDSNWTGGNDPPQTGDSLVFGAAGTSGANLSDNLFSLASSSVSNVTFNSGAAAFTINPAAPGTNGFTLTGTIANNGTNLETINDSIALSGTDLVNTTAGGGNITLGGAISGTVSSTLQIGNNAGANALTPTGTVTLSASNSFTGNITVTQGYLSITNSSALGSGVKNIYDNYNRSSEIDLSNNVTIGSNVTWNLCNDGTSGTNAANGYIATAALRNVSGSNTINGLVNLTSNGGNTAIQSDSGMLTLAGNVTATATSRNLMLQGAATGVISGIISDGSDSTTGGMQVIKNGTGTWSLQGANTFTGGTTISAGTLQVGNGTAGSLASNALNFNGFGTVNFNEASGASQAMGLLTFAAGEGNVQSTYASSGNTTLTFSNVTARAVGSAGNFISSGGTNGTTNKIVFTQLAGATPTTGTLLSPGLFFNGTSYAAYNAGTAYVRAYGVGDTGYLASAGGTVISGPPASTSNVATSGNITAQTTLAINTLNLGANNFSMSAAGQTLSTAGIISAGSNSATFGTGNLQPATAGGELVVNVAGSTDQLVVSSVIQNNTSASALTKAGYGTLRLTGANSYSGGTFIDAGTLQLGDGTTSLTTSGSPAGTGTFSVVGGTVLKFNFASNSSNYNYSQITGAGTVELTSANEFDWAAAGSGSTAAVFNNSFNGTLQIDIGRVPSANLGGVTAVIVNNGGQFATFNNGNGTYTQNFTIAGNYGVESGANGAIRAQNNTFTGNVALSASATIVVGGTSTIAGPISENSAGLSFTLGNTGGYNNGTLILTGASSYTGSTTIAIGTLQLGNGTTGKDGSLTTSGITDNAALVYNLFGTKTASYPISGSGSLTKAGAGTLVLNASNSYTGGTTISAGTVQVGNGTVNGTLGTGAVADSAALTFKSTSGGVALSNVISGTGNVTQLAGVTTLKGASTYTGGTTVSGGTLVAAGPSVAGTSSPIGYGGSLTVASGATFAYEPTAAGTLSVGTLTLNGSTIGTAVGGGTSASAIISSAAASVTGTITVNIYGVPGGITGGSGTYTLISDSAGGLGTSGYSLGTIYNPTNFTVSAGSLTASGTSVTIGLVANGAGTPSASEYWIGGLTGAANVWSASDGNANSNWVTSATGGATPYTPGPTTTEYFSANSTTNSANPSTLGANMSILGIVVNDPYGVGLNADGNTLTIGTSGITMGSSAGATSLAAPIILSGTQSWTNNNTSNVLSVSGTVTNGGFTLTKAGAGAANISGAISGSGGLTVSSGTLTLSASDSYASTTTVNAGSLTIASTGSINGGGTLTVANGATFNLASGASATISVMNEQGGSIVTNIAGNITTSGNQNYIDGLTTQIAGTVKYADAEIAAGGGGSGTYYLGGTGALQVTQGAYNSLDIGQRGTGNFYVSQSGALTNSGSALILGQAYGGANGATNGTLIQQGGTVSATNGVSLGAQANGNNASQNSAGIYYLNGGTLTTSGLTFGSSNHNLGSKFIFGGGTLTTSTAFTVASVASTEETTTINSGGAIINTSGGNLTWNGNILAGTVGNAVAPTVSTPDGSGYTSAPAVTIADGGSTGSGATAVAEINQSGQVVDVVVTNPGSGYSGTETFSFATGNATALTSSPALGNGGLTVQGANTLILAASNTYLGATAISTGTLRANNGASNGSATGSGNITVAAGTSSYGGATLGGNGVVSGTVTLTGSVTAKQGGIITAGVNTTTAGSLTTGNETWNGGGAYTWKIQAAGTAGAKTAAQTGGSSTTWDAVTMGTLSVSATNSDPFTIQLSSLTGNQTTPTATTGFAATSSYSWIIGSATSISLNGAAALSTTANADTKLLTGSSSDIFALDTSGFNLGTSGNSVPSGEAGFELDAIGTGSGDNLVLTYDATPEPGTTLLVLAGALPILATRRRRRRQM
jgi:fibronectin-binding autotransporter adhesin